MKVSVNGGAVQLSSKFGLEPIRDIQVLYPMNRGSLGVRELNVGFQHELNPARAHEPVVEKFGRRAGFSA